MTIFDQIRRENSNISNVLQLKIVNFDTKVKIDHFSSFSRIFSFWTKKWTFDTLLGSDILKSVVQLHRISDFSKLISLVSKNTLSTSLLLLRCRPCKWSAKSFSRDSHNGLAARAREVFNPNLTRRS